MLGVRDNMVIDTAGTWIFLKRAKWTEKFAWLPHRCRISRKLVWLKRGYKGTATFTGPLPPVTETHWHDRGQHLWWILSGKREKEADEGEGVTQSP
jgi:hypothetical protein